MDKDIKDSEANLLGTREPSSRALCMYIEMHSLGPYNILSRLSRSTIYVF